MRIQYLLAVSIVSSWWGWTLVESYYTGKMPKGFHISPRTGGPDRWGGELEFQPFLVSVEGQFAMGFNRIRDYSFLLAIVCVVENESASSGSEKLIEMVWTANRNIYVNGNSEFILLSNGSLALRNGRTNALYWSTDGGGDEVVLLDTGNLQLIDGPSKRIIWQSFDHPTDTLLQGQNFTAAMKLVSSISSSNPGDGPYYLKLQETSIGLLARLMSETSQMYWKRVAMQEKALISPDKGEIYARLESSGFLAMYQTESALVDVLPLDTFHQSVVIRRMKIEVDGNLRSYYWRSPRWEVDFEAIQNSCELPNFCGYYGVCSLQNQCSCLGNFSKNYSISISDQGCSPRNIPVDFCRGWKGEIVMVEGMDLPFKQFANFITVVSAMECRDLCAGNCSCSAAFFYNDSKRCYQVQHPLQTLVQVPNNEKMVFIKLVQDNIKAPSPAAKNSKVFLIIGIAVLCMIIMGMCVCFFMTASSWKKHPAQKDLTLQMSEDFLSGLRGRLPYKDLRDSSFPL